MAKILTKRIVLCLLLIMLTISFCGCASVRAMTITNEDGSIEEQVYVTLDQTAVVEAGYSLAELKQDISSTAVSEGRKIIETLNQKIYLDSLNATDETIQILNSFQNGISVLSNNWDDNEYVISIKFKNIDVYKYYYGVTEETKIETQITKHFFYNKVSFTGSTMYLKYHSLYERLDTAFSNKYMGLLESETNELLYTYTTDLKRQHSNADYVSCVEGKYYHTWVVEDVENEAILFHYNIANSGNWIIVAIGISIFACVVMFVVEFIKRKVNKSVQKQDERIDNQKNTD